MGCTGGTPIVSDFFRCAAMASLDDMPASLPLSSRFRRVAGHLIALVSLATLLAGFAVSRAVETLPVTSAPAAAATTPSASARLTLRFDGHVATAVLDETPAAREFAALLPLTLRLSDPMGQAKSGPLPRSAIAGCDRCGPDVPDHGRSAGVLAAQFHGRVGPRRPRPTCSGAGPGPARRDRQRPVRDRGGRQPRDRADRPGHRVRLLGRCLPAGPQRTKVPSRDGAACPPWRSKS